MFTNEKGYSLSVLVITIAVMLILTMTAGTMLNRVQKLMLTYCSSAVGALTTKTQELI